MDATQRHEGLHAEAQSALASLREMRSELALNPVVANLSGQTRMLDVLRQGFQNSDKIAISVSFLRCSGLGLVLDDLAAFSARGGHARILTSTYLGITQPEALDALINVQGVESRIHVAGPSSMSASLAPRGFHTKFFIFRNGSAECWVGSSNLTKGGLASNLETNLRHTHTYETQSLQDLFDTLWNREDVVPICRQFTEAYATSLRRNAVAPVPWTPIPLDLRYLEQPPVSPIPASQVPTTGSQHTQIRPNEAQVQALAKLCELRRTGEKRAAVIAAPGVGKTYLAAFDARASDANSVLFLSHRLEHLSQARRSFERVFGMSRSYGQVYGGINQSKSDFVFATVQSATDDQTLLHRTFDYVVVDEFHHADSPSYQRLLEALSFDFLLGLTATPERQDGHDVLRLCDYNVAFEVRLVEAVNRGWLLPFHYFGVSDETVDYGQIPWRSGRFDVTVLETALMLEGRVDEILKHARNRGFDGRRRATIGFCAGVRHAKFMADALVRRGCHAISVTGEDTLESRENVYKRFEDPADPLEWIFVADVLNEGVDIPCINSILFLRPTESATVFIQQLGRGLRLTDDSEILTVLDFVGHHRSAWLALEALHDRDAGETSASIPELQFTPPKNCEVVLDSKTLVMLQKLREHSESKKEQCLDTYFRLKADSARPFPLDLWGRDDSPELSVFRAAFGSWIRLRQAANDSEAWEDALQASDAGYELLVAIERDWQQSRVYSYALLWGLCESPGMEPAAAYARFFDRFPRWRVEFKALDETKAWQTLRNKLTHLLVGDRLHPDVFAQIPTARLLIEIEGRIRLTLERDYRLRHGGVLRRPADLVVHRRYDRPEIINHFGSQYDPARHNLGVVICEHDLIIITKLDTSGAKQIHQYVNRFVDSRTFAWQSQNQQRQDNQSGRLVLDHQQNGHSLHLFVQQQSHEKAYYCGKVKVSSVEGNAPMNVQFELEHELSPSMCIELLEAPRLGPEDRNVISEDNRANERAVGNRLPLYSLRAAAGYFGEGQDVEPEGFVDAPNVGASDKEMFVARAVGRSMEPTIYDGDLLVFRINPVGSRQGKIVLAQYRGPADPETGGSYTVKRYSSEKVQTEDGEWRHSRIVLSPLNRAFSPIVISAEAAEDFRIVAEFVAVLPPVPAI